MKSLQLITALILTGNLFAQQIITNNLTEKHLPITGTNMFLVPPGGFTNGTNFFGFEHLDTQSAIMGFEVPAPFTKTSEGFTEEALRKKGMILKKRDTLNINGYNALLFTLKQVAYDKSYTKYTLIFGDDQKTCLLNGMYPDLEEESIGNTLLESLLTVVYNINNSVNPWDAAPFSINIEGTQLQFAQHIAGSFGFTFDGNLPPKTEDKSYFMVSQSYSTIQIQDKKLFALNRIKQLPYAKVEIDEEAVSEISIDSISGYVITGKALNQKTKSTDTIYQVMLFSDNSYYLMIGIIKANMEANLSLFKQIALSFRRK